MNIYSSFDYLCNEAFYLEGIGTVKCPTLRDIRTVTYQEFLLYVNILAMPVETYLNLIGMQTEKNDLLEKESTSLFHLLLYGNPQLLVNMLCFFVTDEITFDESSNSFRTFFKEETGEIKYIGEINHQNFDKFSNEIRYILGLKSSDEEEPKFKNDYAKKMYEMFHQQKNQQKTKQDDTYAFDNMIRKYCTHNKVGINILNVWDMTYYQFITMFNEYCIGRQYDFNDAMAAHTFSYKKSSDYKPMDYMKIID